MMSWLLNPECELVMIQGKFLFRHYHLWLCGYKWVLTSSSFRENDVNSSSHMRVASHTPWMYICKALGTWHLRRTQTLAVRVLDARVGVHTVMANFHSHLSFCYLCVPTISHVRSRTVSLLNPSCEDARLNWIRGKHFRVVNEDGVCCYLWLFSLSVA